MDKAILTIAIPTYNRANQLEKSLRDLIKQLDHSIIIRVIENRSDNDCSHLISKLQRTEINIHYKANVDNIGISGNIIKCFESCDTEWLWILSDDDEIAQDALNTIKEAISLNYEVAFFNFRSNLFRYSWYNNHYEKFVGQYRFVEGLKSFTNLLFLSSGVYNVKKLKESIRSAYYFTNTFAPQVALVLDHLGNNDKAVTCFVDKPIVNWKPPLKGHAWSKQLLDKSLMDLVFLIRDERARKIFFEKVSVNHPYSRMTGRQAIKNTLFTDTKISHLLTEYLDDKIFINWCTGRKNFTAILKHGLLSVLLRLLRWPGVRSLCSGLIKDKSIVKQPNYNRYQSFKKDNRL